MERLSKKEKGLMHMDNSVVICFLPISGKREMIWEGGIMGLNGNVKKQ